jgi:DNA-damage-inducible protein I
MIIEICIAKDKISKSPKGSTEALKQEMTCRVSQRYDNVEVIVKSVSNDCLSVLRAPDKDAAKKEFINETLRDTKVSTDDWFVQ